MTTAAVYLVGWAIFFVWQPEMSDTPGLVLWIGSGVLAGALIGRWWALALALAWAGLALLGVAVFPCNDAEPGVECDIDWTWLILVLYLPITTATLAAGVVVGQLARSRRHRHRPG